MKKAKEKIEDVVEETIIATPVITETAPEVEAVKTVENNWCENPHLKD